MKLSQVIRRHFILGVFIVMILGCISHYFIFEFFINYSADKVLYDYKAKIERYVKDYKTLPTFPSSILPSRIDSEPIENPEMHPEYINDTIIYNPISGEKYSYRQLHFPIYYDNHWYVVTINRQMLKSNDMMFVIVSSLMVLFLLFVLFSFFINFYMKRNIWNTFYKNLSKLDHYDLKANTVLKLTDPGIKEFDKLNEVIMQMVKKINQDYENSRKFIEDSSHEMQTPLSIIKSKLEHFIQDNAFKNKEQAKDIQAMLRAVNRLSKITHSLTLINKINNNQFSSKKSINIPELVKNFIEDFQELIDIKDISLNYDLKSFYSEINPELSEILVSNLINNSIKHNFNGGFIIIEAKENYLLIENSCNYIPSDENLFNRFVYNNKSKDSSGLGLNIVKSICDTNNLQVEYKYLSNEVFKIKVWFI
ncbi:HAMP domain-containing sensor histidine kinase [Apibacter raozihei]|uniref:sensor histidine kinase n=1 Tax=Apibacter TaxID=1778601 RepID=UPI000FE3EC2C|nr:MULTISPECIES: HAMP domain-containing sensor histidine kinase [Apibacter]